MQQLPQEPVHSFSKCLEQTYNIKISNQSIC
ncbi:Serine/threonine protein kinase [Giardia duodenalis assemblage B]|uniref:Serine/threonine protein kinase n=2 Tax=Giardia intestinalis TaxID=5741 RepID=A0A132NV95_GIAIN|nr:Serine/threonine protein kinase [Giardia intestinalis]KWX13985.1 Serine/threonine protein kinase [Giardia intestinalis assemblage B]